MSVVCGVIAAAAVVFAALGAPLNWIVLGLQLTTLAGCVFGLLWSRGAFETGPVLGLLCAAGAVVTGAMLAYVANRGLLGPIAMKWWSLAELACGASLAGIALWSALDRDSTSKGPAIRGVLLSMPAVALCGVLLMGSRLGVTAALDRLPMLVRFGALLILGVFAAILLCIGTHYLAIAFGKTVLAGRRHAA